MTAKNTRSEITIGSFIEVFSKLKNGVSRKELLTKLDRKISYVTVLKVLTFCKDSKLVKEYIKRKNCCYDFTENGRELNYIIKDVKWRK